MPVLHRATPERLSAFSDGVFAVLITVLVLELRPPELPTFKALSVALAHVAKLRSELPVHRHRVDQSPLSHALCHGGDPSSVVVQFRAPVFRVAASALHRLDGREQTGAATGCLLCGGLLPRERNLHLPNSGSSFTEARVSRFHRRCAGSCTSDRSRLYAFSEWLRW